MILAQDFLSEIPKYIENVTVGAYFEWANVLSIAKAWDRSSVHKTDIHVRFGNGRAQALVSPRMSLNKFPSPYAILKNIIIRSKYVASARHPMVHASAYMESTVTS